MKSQHVSITKTKSYLSCFEAFIVEFFVNFLYVILQRRHWKQRYHVKATKSQQKLVTYKNFAPEYEEIHFRSRRELFIELEHFEASIAQRNNFRCIWYSPGSTQSGLRNRKPRVKNARMSRLRFPDTSSNNRPFALRGHVTSFLWKWKLYDFFLQKTSSGSCLEQKNSDFVFKPAPFS